jgi:hypothetical protein
MHGRRRRQVCLEAEALKTTSIHTAILGHHATKLLPTQILHKEPREVWGASKELGRILM